MAVAQTKSNGPSRVANEYSCPECETSNNVHRDGCDHEGEDIERIEKAYVGILSVMTLPQFDGICHQRLAIEVNSMLGEDSWGPLFNACFEQLKDSGAINEDRDGSLHMVPPEERRSDAPLGEDPSEKKVRDALNSIDPDVEYYDWVRLQYAVRDWNDGEKGKILFKEWSKKGSKWDRDSERMIEYGWRKNQGDDGATLATLAYLALDHGWSP